jgi:hypothetical protein
MSPTIGTACCFKAGIVVFSFGIGPRPGSKIVPVRFKANGTTGQDRQNETQRHRIKNGYMVKILKN